MTTVNINIFFFTLIYEFWLSGLFVLSVIFLDIEDLDTLTLLTFSSYALGSFLAGVLSDIVGRQPLFIISSLLLFVSSIWAYFDIWGGFILANLCIGPLNNLTFIFLNENPELSQQRNFVKVILGWVASQICLGLFFMQVSDQQLFLLLLIPLTGLFSILASTFTEQTPNFIANKNNLRKKECLEVFIPKEIKALVGGAMLMFMMQMFYYRTQFTLDRFGVSLQINTILVGCTEGLANIIFSIFVRKCKRKVSLIILLSLLMVLLMCLILIKSPQWQTAIEGTMRFFDSCIMLVLGIYLPELFSIGERGKGTNYVMSVGVFGSALSGKLFSKLPFGYLQIFLFAALIGLLLLPETLDKREREEVEVNDLNQNLTSQV